MLPLVTLVALSATPTPFTRANEAGRLELAHGVLSAPASGDLREAALRFAESRRADLGLPASSTLRAVDGFSTRFGATVHLAQQVEGVDVQAARLVVTFDAQARVVRVASSVLPYQRAVMNWRLSGPEALAVGSAAVEGALLHDDGSPWGGYDPRVFSVEGQAHAGYLVYVPTARRSEAWYAAVDATTGEVLWVDNRARSAAASAQVYASSPGGQPAAVAARQTVELNHLLDGGTLTGTQFKAFNCCPTENCAPDAGPRRVSGTLQQGGGSARYDFAICDRRQRATNDPAVHASGDFVYTPVDPPVTSAPSLASLADYDEFSEVNAYFHVNRAYDYVRSLSVGPFGVSAGVTPFRMRDLTRNRVPAVWANPSEPDLQRATQNAQGVYVSNSLTRVDNAMFVPLENMAALSVPEYAFDTDALIVYQGDTVDFAYDGPVLWHEFGHGVHSSTSNWQPTLSVDGRSANLESQAIEEGSADVLSAMVGNRSKVGEYVAPHTGGGGTLRDADNTLKCPEVLWGESHQDGQHYTGAIWQARATLFQGADNGATFDAAYYAAVVSFPPDVDFGKAAAIIAAQVGQAFPNISNAEQQMKALFDARGVTNCSKVVEVQAGAQRAYYGTFGTQVAAMTTGTPIPGPYQLKLNVPNGAKRISVSGVTFSFGGGGSRLQFLAKRGAPITFERSGSTLVNDAEAMVVPTATRGELSGAVDLAVPCGSDVYVTLANTGSRERPIQQLAISYTPADSCPPVVDAGQPDAGSVNPIVLPLAPEQLGGPLSCGCTSGAAAGWLIPVVVWRRRRTRPASK